MGAITDFVYQILGAFGGFAPAGTDPMFFWGSFLLIFAIVWAALVKVKIFGEGNKVINAIVALVIAYFAASSTFTTIVLSKIFPNFSIAAVAILIFLIIIALVSGEDAKISDNRLVMAVAALIVIWLVVNVTFQLSGAGLQIPNVFAGWEAMDWFLIALVIIAIVAIFKPPKILGG